ncbi:MAG: ornithine carbamoyltransferase [Watsoniomyces obsoletus]|nr:MAG: ornithine carbamoyltransferase [Watsoniomyces obsoletus]
MSAWKASVGPTGKYINRYLRPSTTSKNWTSNIRAWTPIARSSTATGPLTSPFAPRHLLSIADLTPQELSKLVLRAKHLKNVVKTTGISPESRSLAGQTVALMFSKRSTRTRVSTEAAVASMGGHPLFLGKDDIQLGVNETLYDTSVVISSMVSAIVARVGPHADIEDLAKHSSVPVINALSDKYHPMQTMADFLTILEAHPQSTTKGSSGTSTLGLEGLKIAWVGDANNVLFDLGIGARKLGVNLAVATPRGYSVPPEIKGVIEEAGSGVDVAGQFSETNVPEEAVKNADIVVTDTWVSMGQEEEKAKRLQDFAGFQITEELLKRGGARTDCRFMHCLPRHAEEVSDEVFYSPRSLVFKEAENRLWAAMATLEFFVLRKGRFDRDIEH